MKGVLTVAAIILIGSGIVLTNSCKKNDTSSPVITVSGAAKVTISLNSQYNDPGATASDVVDGSDVVSSDYSPTNPDVNLAGTYTIHYTAVDNAGNSAAATRTVIVVNDAQNVAGIYAVIDTVTGKYASAYSYNVTVTASTTLDNQLFLTDFSGLGYTTVVTALVSGNTISLNPANQMPSGMVNPGTINGSGTILTGSKITEFTYIITYNPGSDTGVSTWTKQ